MLEAVKMDKRKDLSEFDKGQIVMPSCVGILLLLSVCKQHASLICMLRLFFAAFGEFQAPPRGLECELQRFESFSVDPCGRKYS